MSIILASQDNSSAVRLGASIQLRECLHLVTFYMSLDMQKEFLTTVPANIQTQIKINLLSSLPAASGPLLQNICLCLAKFTMIHLHESACSDIIDKLFNLVLDGSTQEEKEEAMEAINKICILVLFWFIL